MKSPNTVVDNVAERANEFVGTAQDKANDLLDQGAKALKQADKEAQKAIKANPYPSVAIAFGAGIILGILFTKSRS